MLHLCAYTVWNCPTWVLWWRLHGPKTPAEKDCEHFSGDDENFVDKLEEQYEGGSVHLTGSKRHELGEG